MMYAVEFEANVNDGVVYIPKNINDLGKNYRAKFVMMINERKKNQSKAKSMSAISIDMEGFKFDREEAHAR